MTQLVCNEFIFQQWFEATCSGYTYLIADANTLEGVIIDPVFETLERDLKMLKELGVTLKYILDTHVHADHVTGSGRLAEKTGALIAMSAASGADASVLLQDNQILECGSLRIKALATPGHTDGCMCYLIGNAVFTGDTLLIRGNGRTDFQNGSAATLYDSITQKLYSLPDDTVVFPAHEYTGLTSSTIGLEKKYNKRLRAETSKADFIRIMSELNLPLPKKIDIALPANLKCAREYAVLS